MADAIRILRGPCAECGANKGVHANGTVERHTRKLKGRPGRHRCPGTGRKVAQ